MFEKGDKVWYVGKESEREDQFLCQMQREYGAFTFKRDGRTHPIDSYDPGRRDEKVLVEYMPHCSSWVYPDKVIPCVECPECGDLFGPVNHYLCENCRTDSS